MNNRIGLTLKSIDISRLFANKLDHGFSYKEYKWRLFEPTKFIYSFFTFNMLYEVDWAESLKRLEIKEAGRTHYVENQYSKIYTSDKVKLLLNFIYLNNGSKSFFDYYKIYDADRKVINNSKNIRSDNNISKLDKSSENSQENSYLYNYQTSILKIGNDAFNKEDHYKILIFCYQIRNNIFHGLKKATEMNKSGQKERLLDYSHIILATIDMFFEVMKSEYNYRSASEDELEENAGLKEFN